MKKKLLTLILGFVMALSVVAIGVYALTTVNLGVTGTISFIAYDKQVYVEDITIKNLVEETTNGYKSTNKTYEEYQGVYLKGSNSKVSIIGKVLKGETLEIDITSLSYQNLPDNVLVRSTGLYMPQNQGERIVTGQSRMLKIYITNNNENYSTLDLSTINLSIKFEELSSLIHEGTRLVGEETKTFFYVEMGTIPGTANESGLATEEYLKWRYISGDGKMAYISTTAPTNTIGTYILETNVTTLTQNNSMLINDVEDMGMLGTKTYTLLQVAYQNQHKLESGGYVLSENENIAANDYAYSTVRKYINGEKIYKRNTSTSHYSDMFSDFCIDTENDLIYKKIISRTLTSLYSDIWETDVYLAGVSDSEKNFYALNNDYDMNERDKFWLPSYVELRDLLCNKTWSSASVTWDVPYYFRSICFPLETWSGLVNSSGTATNSLIMNIPSIRPCFNLG